MITFDGDWWIDRRGTPAQSLGAQVQAPVVAGHEACAVAGGSPSCSQLESHDDTFGTRPFDAAEA